VLLDAAFSLLVKTRAKRTQLDTPVRRRVENVFLILELLAKKCHGSIWYELDSDRPPEAAAPIPMCELPGIANDDHLDAKNTGNY
jgi:hypothetical protein